MSQADGGGGAPSAAAEEHQLALAADRAGSALPLWPLEAGATGDDAPAAPSSADERLAADTVNERADAKQYVGVQYIPCRNRPFRATLRLQPADRHLAPGSSSQNPDLSTSMSTAVGAALCHDLLHLWHQRRTGLPHAELNFAVQKYAQFPGLLDALYSFENWPDFRAWYKSKSGKGGRKTDALQQLAEALRDGKPLEHVDWSAVPSTTPTAHKRRASAAHPAHKPAQQPRTNCDADSEGGQSLALAEQPAEQQSLARAARLQAPPAAEQLAALPQQLPASASQTPLAEQQAALQVPPAQHQPAARLQALPAAEQLAGQQLAALSQQSPASASQAPVSEQQTAVQVLPAQHQPPTSLQQRVASPTALDGVAAALKQAAEQLPRAVPVLTKDDEDSKRVTILGYFEPLLDAGAIAVDQQDGITRAVLDKTQPVQKWFGLYRALRTHASSGQVAEFCSLVAKVVSTYTSA